MPAFRAAGGFFQSLIFLFLTIFAVSFAYAAEDKCDAASKTGGGTVTNDCKVCVTTVTGEKKWVGASCTVTGGGDKTSANCAANHGVAPGTCATKYCVGTKCFNAEVDNKPKLEDALGLKNETALNNLQGLLSNPESGASGVTPVKDDPTAGQLGKAFDQSPSLEKVASGLSGEALDKQIEDIGLGLNPETKAAELQSALDKAAELRAQGKDVSVQVESQLSLEQRAQLLADHGIDPSTLDPQDPLRQYAEKGVTDTFAEPPDSSGLDSCTGIWDCTVRALQEGFQDLFSGENTSVEPGNLYLAAQRAELMAELDTNLALRDKVAAVIATEMGGGGPGSQAVLESMVNRALMRGYTSLDQAIDDGFYGPINRGEVDAYLSTGVSAVDRAVADNAIAAVRGGSNICNLCTDQGMINEIRGPKWNIGGEWFGHMAGDSQWADEQGVLQAAYDADAAIPWNGSIGNTPSSVVTTASANWGNMSASPVQVASIDNSVPSSGDSTRGTTVAGYLASSEPPPVPLPNPQRVSGSPTVAQSIPDIPVSKSSVYSSLPITEVSTISEVPEIKVVSNVPSISVTGGSQIETLPTGADIPVVTTQSEVPGARVITDVPSIPTTDVTPSWLSETWKTVQNRALDAWSGLTRTPFADVGPTVELFDIKPSAIETPAPEAIPPASFSDTEVLPDTSPSLQLIGDEFTQVVARTAGETWENLRQGWENFAGSPTAPKGGAITQESQGAPPAGSVSSQQIGAPSSEYGRGYYELGDQDPSIHGIQKFLNEQGYPLTENGPGSPGNETDVFGPRTLQAAKAFQEANGLTADGLVGPKTIAKMNEIAASDSVSRGVGQAFDANTSANVIPLLPERSPIRSNSQTQTSAAPPAQSAPPAANSVTDPALAPAAPSQQRAESSPLLAPAPAAQQAQQQAPAVARQAAVAAQRVSAAASTANAEGEIAQDALDSGAGKAALDKLYATVRNETNKVISAASGTYKSDVSSQLTALGRAVVSAKRGIDGVVKNWGSSSSQATLRARTARVRSVTNNLVTILRNSPK